MNCFTSENKRIEPDEIQVSDDVTNLYPLIPPIDKAIDVIL